MTAPGDRLAREMAAAVGANIYRDAEVVRAETADALRETLRTLDAAIADHTWLIAEMRRQRGRIAALLSAEQPSPS